MTEINWPTADWARPSSCSFTPRTRSLFSSSPLRRGRRVFGSIVDQWVAQVTFDNLPPQLWTQLSALIARLDGPAGTLRMWDASRFLPRGMAAGLNLDTVVGIGQPFSDNTYFTDGTGWLDVSAYGVVMAGQPAGSDSILIGGLIANQPLSLAAGDLFEVGGYLYMATADTASDANGMARVMIRPRLRLPALAGDSVKFAYPTSPFQLVDDEQGGVEVASPVFGSFGLSLVEIVP